jgi:G3E family GTPase
MVSTSQTHQIPVTLITGFLGSGKTTQLNTVLRDPAFAGTLVIVNEFGDVGLDHLLVDSTKDQVLLLDSGCLCCASSGNLRDTLIDLFVRRNAGAIPPFDRIMVETSGLAHPGPLTATLIGDSALLSRYKLSQVLTVVDAANGAQTLTSYQEARDQVAMADTLVIGKTDTANLAQIQQLTTMLSEWNPYAPIHQWKIGQDTAHILASDSSTKNTVLSKPEVWIENLMGSRHLRSKDVKPASLWGNDLLNKKRLAAFTHSSAFQSIQTYTLRFGNTPMSWPSYAALTQVLSHKFGRMMLRCKGLLRLQGEHPWIIQGVQGYFSKPTRLSEHQVWNESSFLVCIGATLNAERLHAITEEIPELRDLVISSSHSLEKINS